MAATRSFDPALHRQQVQGLLQRQEALLSRPNRVDAAWSNGIYQRYEHCVITAEHVPITWRYDLNPQTNPLLLERLGVNAAFNPGAIFLDGKYCLVCRVEGVDRKSFFAVARSAAPTEGFRFDDEPVTLPQVEPADTNVYDMRLTAHEDGCIYGMFCTERHDPQSEQISAAVAQCGIVRTTDLIHWERLPDLITPSAQQRNCVLHPTFIDGQYAFYTRPQNSFLNTAPGGGIGFGLARDITHAEIAEERIVDPKVYHTVNELKNGAGAPPLRTERGWLHIAHGVRETAAGLRYVLYVLLCDLHEPWRVTHRPAGYFIAPRGGERVGDVSNVVFCNGAIAAGDGAVYVYYASSDTRIHVAATSVDQLLDYTLHTPADTLHSAGSVSQRLALIRSNRAWLAQQSSK